MARVGTKGGSLRAVGAVLCPVLLAAVTWIAFDWFDPIGYSQATSSHSRRLAERIRAPFLGGPGDAAQNSMAVVLLEDEDIPRGTTWPVDYYEHAKILEQILEAGPAAVFVDFHFGFGAERRSIMNLETMFDVVAEARENAEAATGHTIPVLFARGKPDGEVSPALRKQVEAGRLELAVSTWEKVYDAYPLQPKAGTNSPPPALALSPSPAYRIYRHLCATAFSAAVCPQMMNEQDFEQSLYVYWGEALPEGMAAFSDNKTIEQCRLTDPSWSARAYEALSLTLYAPVQRLGEVLGSPVPARQECPFTLTIGPNQLGSKAAREALAGKVVFYGAQVRAAPDMHETPVHGMMPGVYIHAMALYNLMLWGPEYTRSPSASPIPGLDYGDLSELMVLVVLSLAMTLCGRRLKALNKYGRYRHRFREISILTLIAALAVAVAATLMALGRWPAANVLGIAGFAVALAELGDWEVGVLVKRLLRGVFSAALAILATIVANHYWQVSWPACAIAVLVTAWVAIILPLPAKWQRRLIRCGKICGRWFSSRGKDEDAGSSAVRDDSGATAGGTADQFLGRDAGRGNSGLSSPAS